MNLINGFIDTDLIGRSNSDFYAFNAGKLSCGGPNARGATDDDDCLAFDGRHIDRRKFESGDDVGLEEALEEFLK